LPRFESSLTNRPEKKKEEYDNKSGQEVPILIQNDNPELTMKMIPINLSTLRKRNENDQSTGTPTNHVPYPEEENKAQVVEQDSKALEDVTPTVKPDALYPAYDEQQSLGKDKQQASPLSE
jgi:hypothetical protein